MQDQPIESPLACGDVEFAVMVLLLDPVHLGPWSVGELALEVGCEAAAERAVASLRASGLVHRVGEFVFVSRTASRFSQLLRE